MSEIVSAFSIECGNQGRMSRHLSGTTLQDCQSKETKLFNCEPPKRSASFRWLQI